MPISGKAVLYDLVTGRYRAIVDNMFYIQGQRAGSAAALDKFWNKNFPFEDGYEINNDFDE
jgi:hypothetical protein